MNNKFTEERERFLNSISDIPPPPFRVGDIVVRQPIEQEIYQKQIDPWEQSLLLGYGSVKEYIYRKQYWEANDLDDIMFEEFEMRQEGKGVPKMEERNRWGRRDGKGTPGGCKDGILLSMQKCTAPGVTMDKPNENKMLPQGKTAVEEG